MGQETLASHSGSINEDSIGAFAYTLKHIPNAPSISSKSERFVSDLALLGNDTRYQKVANAAYKNNNGNHNNHESYDTTNHLSLNNNGTKFGQFTPLNALEQASRFPISPKVSKLQSQYDKKGKPDLDIITAESSDGGQGRSAYWKTGPGSAPAFSIEQNLRIASPKRALYGQQVDLRLHSSKCGGTRRHSLQVMLNEIDDKEKEREAKLFSPSNQPGPVFSPKWDTFTERFREGGFPDRSIINKGLLNVHDETPTSYDIKVDRHGKETGWLRSRSKDNLHMSLASPFDTYEKERFVSIKRLSGTDARGNGKLDSSTPEDVGPGSYEVDKVYMQHQKQYLSLPSASFKAIKRSPLFHVKPVEERGEGFLVSDEEKVARRYKLNKDLNMKTLCPSTMATLDEYEVKNREIRRQRSLAMFTASQEQPLNMTKASTVTRRIAVV